MIYRSLGNTDIKVSAIGMGCWAIGGDKWGPIDDRESVSAIKKAISLGINFFDTADFYGFGHSEDLIGRAVGKRSDVIIATKVGLRWNKKGKVFHDLGPSYISIACEASLKRLDRETIDLYQIHWPDPETDFSEVFVAIEKLVREGKVRYVGACNLSLGQLQALRKFEWFVSYQDKFNLFRRGVKKEILPYCEKENIAFIAYEPLFKGMLTGKFKDYPKFEKGDHRKYKGRFTRNFQFYKDKVDFLKAIASKHKLTTTELSLAMLLKEKGVTSVIPGAKTTKQVAENAKAADVDESVLEKIHLQVNGVLTDV